MLLCYNFDGCNEQKIKNLLEMLKWRLNSELFELFLGIKESQSDDLQLEKKERKYFFGILVTEVDA